MNFKELDNYLKGVTSYNYESNDNILNHFQNKYQSINYHGKPLYIFNNQRQFNNKNHLIQLHKRNMGKVPYHTYHFIVLTYIYCGSLTMLVEGKKIYLKQGDLIILDKQVPHCVLPSSKMDLGINIILSNKFFDNTIIKPEKNNSLPTFIIELMGHQYEHNHFLIFSTNLLPIIRNSIQNILCEYFDNNEFSSQIIDNLIIIIFMSLVRLKPIEDSFTSANPKVEKLMSEILKYAHEEYKEGKLNKLCEKINYSPSHVSRMIHTNTGKTFKSIINYQRIEHAKVLLQDKKTPISEVATRVGVNNLTNFYKRFEKETGMTPKKYRDNLKN
ncbi:AraC family transcriptional regulator [Companilactobacillus alimentarius]|uniref:HTH araC/xylS-type domain-containing protein n=1 Tax=Companilactobacillus alimentarius DSM 20249 TaxID=1423720 RepID=A0A2K9HF82_9LACO|nr:AraC family transcriptional regulator [Companilactobacillus alimentarius]AUI71219.1 hypothetical protein LA20249_02965 [Companilactobacillus alimentarius DSM 20249]MDT6951502.1 AraC family transcriptional regulator [Companilactobacillus alimentarius]GEO43863.1 AraC family transcriptional regulator [Companilactobacillus alimentarius]